MNRVSELKSNTNNGEENNVETSESEVNMGGNFTWDVNSAVPLTADELEPLFVTMTGFLSAIPNVQPSAKVLLLLLTYHGGKLGVYNLYDKK